MDDIKWAYRPFLAGLALTYCFLGWVSTGETPPVWLLSLTITAWGWVFVSREKEKADAQKATKITT